ncbi:MAG: aminopeptidase P family protein [Xanthomonadales bacterium]|jgi:hypothetical protein|nr:aminopeptidase P family protein [Xanthomonadales bacterium]
MPHRLAAALAALLCTLPAAAAEPAQGRVIDSAADYAVLAPRARIEPENRMLTERLDTLLPRLMAEAELDLWLVINREYAEDPVYFSLVPQPSFAARRTTMLVFHRQADGKVARLSVNRYPLGGPYESAWSGGDLAAQWKALGELIRAKDPKRIGINVSRHWPVADGLTQGLHQQLLEVLPEGWASRLVPAEGLVVRWLETRTPGELAVYPHIMGIARGVIAEGFSSRVITPGVTTTDDVAWYLRSRFESMGLPIWFMPYVNLQRPGEKCEKDTDFCGISGVIQPGDVIHTDVGICYLKLCTDTQEMGYVAKPGETEVPGGLQAAMATGNRWQDLLTGNFRAGRTGNQILAATRKSAESEGIVSSTYTHPLGLFGHAPGPTIGMWDNQGDTPVQGDWLLHPSTAYAIEGNIKQAVPEWGGQLVQVKLEQGALYDGERVVYLAGRQTRWHLVR